MSGTQFNTGLSSAVAHPDRVPDNPGNRRTAVGVGPPSIVRHRVSGPRRPTSQAFTLSRSNHSDSQHFGSSGKNLGPKRAFTARMFNKPFSPSGGFRVVSAAALGIALAVLGGRAFSAQDKYTVRVPNGLAFSDFRGYENWQVVAVSQTEDLLK